MALCHVTSCPSKKVPRVVQPRVRHWTTIKLILKYLRRTRDYMLIYGAKDLILTGYTDFDFQTDKDSRKSMSGLVYTLNGGIVVCRSIKQGCNSKLYYRGWVGRCLWSNTRSSLTQENFLHDFKVVLNINMPITLYCDDNSRAVAILKNLATTNKENA